MGVIAGAVTTVVLEGIGFALSGAMDLFNHLSLSIKDMSDDGGSIYLTEVTAHTLIRLSTAALVYNGDGYHQTIGFDYDSFLDSLGQNSWDDKNGSAVKYSPDGDHFRTWRPDYSVNYQNVGMLVSCKIDGIRDNNTDDHVILAATYNIDGQLVTAQAVVRMENEDTVDTGTITYDSSQNLVQMTSMGSIDASQYNDIPSAIHDIMQNGMMQNSGYDDYTDQRKNLPHITKINLNAMSASIKPC